MILESADVAQDGVRFAELVSRLADIAPEVRWSGGGGRSLCRCAFGSPPHTRRTFRIPCCRSSMRSRMSVGIFTSQRRRETLVLRRSDVMHRVGPLPSLNGCGADTPERGISLSLSTFARWCSSAVDAFLTTSQVPGITLSSDFISGFCGETEGDHMVSTLRPRCPCVTPWTRRRLT